MDKQQIIQSLNDYVDQIVEQHKREQFSRYVKSKKVTFEECYMILEPRNPFIFGQTKSRWKQKITFRTYKHRMQTDIKCSCPDWNHNLQRKQVPCKHIFALIERYKSKRNHINNTIKGE